MSKQNKYIVSHAPFWHDGSGIRERSYHTMLAALPAVLMGFFQYGVPAVGVVSVAVGTAMLWEWAMNKAMKRPLTIGDGNAALIGLIFAMLIPAATPWWVVATGTLIAIGIGKQIFGGIGGNPFNPAVVALSILIASWGHLVDFDTALVSYDFVFNPGYPLGLLKHFGVAAISDFSYLGLLMGQQTGGIGATFGLGLILGGIYLILRGFVRWEIPLAFLVGVFISALIFNIADPQRYAGPFFHLLTGYTLIGAFFLAPEDSSSPVNTIPMLIYGLGGGVLTVLIRNIGVFVDGVLLAVLLMNLINPLLDKIRPKALGKVG
jgi:electron transport complex protein RnfD